jgi:hypothetical protein
MTREEVKKEMAHMYKLFDGENAFSEISSVNYYNRGNVKRKNNYNEFKGDMVRKNNKRMDK